MIPVDTRYWEIKWDKTCGYLVFKDSFSGMDVNNARWRYNRTDDKNFPIAFDKKTFSIIKHRLTEVLDKKDFWAAVVAPTQAFFDNDWREYAPRGEEFRQINLAALLSNQEKVDHLPVDQQDYVRMVAGKELMGMGMGSTRTKLTESFTPTPMKVNTNYDKKHNYSGDDVLNSMDDILDSLY